MPALEQSAEAMRMPRFSSAAKSILSNWLGFFFTSVVAFFLSPFVVHHLGNSGYGIWALTLSVTGYLGLLDLGVRGAVTRYVAKFHAQADHENAGGVVSSALAIFLGAGVLTIAFSIGIALFAIAHLKIPDFYQLAAKVALILTGINIAVSLVSGVFGGIVAALQRFDLSNGLEIISSGLRTIAIVIVLSRGHGLISLAIVHLLFGILTGLGYAVLAFRLYPQLRIRIGGSDKKNLNLIFSFSSYSFLLQVSSSLIFYSDSVVIGAFLPVSAVTFFVIAGNLMSYSRGLLSGISTVSAPLASALEARGQMDEVKRVLLKGSRFATMVFFPIGITFLVRGKSFIGLWMGLGYAALSGEVLLTLAIAQLFASGNHVPASMSMGISRHKGIVPAVLLEALSNLALSIVLIRNHGIIGVAFGTAIPNLVVQVTFWPWYIYRVYRIRPAVYASSTWIRPGIAALPFVLATCFVEKYWPARSLVVFFAQILCVLPIALIAFWFTCVSVPERSEYSQRFLKLLRRA